MKIGQRFLLLFVLAAAGAAAAEGASGSDASNTGGTPETPKAGDVPPGAGGVPPGGNSTEDPNKKVVPSIPNSVLFAFALLVTAATGFVTFKKYKEINGGTDKYAEMYRTAEEEPPQGYEFDLDTPQREEFVKLLEENELEPDKHPKQKMCQALFNRAYMLVPKIMKIEADHVGLSVAKSKNLVGENVWEEYQFAKECMNEEIAAIQEAANELQAGWAPSIVGEAVRNYMNNNKEEGEKRVRDVLKAHGKDVPAAEPAAAAAAPAAAPQSKAVASPQGGGEAGKEGVQIKAGGQGRVDCYGQSHPEFKAMLREKFVPTANAQQLKFFLMFNDPKMMNIEENTAGWSEEKFKEATLELLDIKDLAILCIPPQYWVDEVDNSRDDNFFAQGGKLMEAQKFQEAFQFFMGALAQMQNNVELWRATANVLLMTGQFQNGVVHLLEVIRRIRNCDPRKPDLLFNLASCLGNMGGEGSLEASKLVLSHALALDPAHKLSLDAIAKVDQGIAQAKLAAA